MKFYRVKQFIWAALSRVNEEDRKYIKKYLNEEEQSLLIQLAVSEQKHSIRVAQEVEKIIESYEEKDRIKISKEDFLRLALLHDIGKIEKKLNIVDKSIVVILNKLAENKMRSLTNIKKIDVYYNHGEMGYKILKKLNRYEDRFLYLVRNHHNNDIINDVELNILRRADSLS